MLPGATIAGRRRRGRLFRRERAHVRGTTPWRRTSSTCHAVSSTTATGSRITWNVYIWPKFVTLKKAPIPTELSPSFACVEIHCASKFCCER